VFPGPLLGNLVNFDILQDFHLPDDQFAFLKLHKLHQVAVDSGVERFTPAPYNTRGCDRRSETRRRRSAIPLALTPTISNSPRPAEAKPAADLTGESAEETPRRDVAEISGERPIEKRHPAPRTPTASTESVTAVRDCAAEYREGDPASVDHPVELQKENDDVITGPSDELQIKEPAVISSEERTDCPGSVHAVESGNYRTDTSVTRTPSSDRLGQEPPNAAAQLCNDSGAPGESPAKASEAASPPPGGSVANRVPPPLLPPSPPLASAPRPPMTPRPHSSAPPSGPAMPSLGLSPHPLPPPARRPAPRALSASPTASSESPSAGDRSPGVGPPNRPTLSGVRSEGSGGRGETAEEHMRRCTHTLEVSGCSQKKLI